jgi:hypothetical protein
VHICILYSPRALACGEEVAMFFVSSDLNLTQVAWWLRALGISSYLFILMLAHIHHIQTLLHCWHRMQSIPLYCCQAFLKAMFIV